MSQRPTCVVSGGQTGVDRAALDAALRCGLPIAGWCPRGRRAEDGTIPPHYPLQETPDAAYEQRTAWNVRDADATLIVSPLPLTGGTAYTLACAREFDKPVLVIDPAHPEAASRMRAWFTSMMMERLNVAGPRASTYPDIYQRAYALLVEVLSPV